MKTEHAIKQRHVDLDQVSLHEGLGRCFGRKPGCFSPEFKKIETEPERYL